MKNAIRIVAEMALGLSLLPAALVASPGQTAPQTTRVSEARPPKLNFMTHKLANGLEVVLLEEHSDPIISLQIWYHVGSKDELPGHSGFAHLFEHLMFKGSAHVGVDEHSESSKRPADTTTPRRMTTRRTFSRCSPAIICSGFCGSKPTAWAA